MAQRASRRAATKKRRSRRKKGRRPGTRRGKILLAVTACLLSGLLLGTLALYVSVTHRFDGRLWLLPSRVYSDTLLLTPGTRIPRTALGKIKRRRL